MLPDRSMTSTASPARAAGALRRAQDETGGARQCCEHRAVLPVERSRDDSALAIARQRAAQVVLPAIVRRQIAAEHGLDDAVRRSSCQASPRGRHARKSSHKPAPTRDCPGRPSTGVSPMRPNINGFPGRIAICQKSSCEAFGPQCRADKVVLADRNAARGHEQISICGAGARTAAMRRPCQARRRAGSARRPTRHEGGERDAVRRDDLIRADRLAGHHHFVAGRAGSRRAACAVP